MGKDPEGESFGGVDRSYNSEDGRWAKRSATRFRQNGCYFVKVRIRSDRAKGESIAERC